MHTVSRLRPLRSSRTRAVGFTSHLESRRFETILAQSLAAIARVPTDEIDHEIEHWLGEICLALDLDRSVMMYLNRGVTHRWSRQNIPRVRYGTTALHVSPWAATRILAGEELVWSSISELPRDAEDYKRWLRKNGPKAQVALPLRAGGLVVGGITFGKFRSTRQWPTALIQRLRLVAEVFGAAAERKRVESELARARSELAAASSSAMMGELAASIAHEVNQPLGAILSNAQAARRLLSMPATDPQKIASALNDIVDDSKRAGEVVARVKSLFRGERTACAPIEVSTLLSEAQTLLRSEAAIRRIDLRITVHPSLPPILGDRVQLLQCIMNLAINGFDSIDCAQSEQREVEIRAEHEHEKWLRIAVCDSGAGIDPKIGERIFEPFVTTKPQGMGMGLLIARSIVERHGGKIAAEANARHGARVSFTLPFCPHAIATEVPQ